MVEYTPFSWEIQNDPFPVYKRLRDEAPAYHNEAEDFWILSRYEDCRRALLDVETFSNAHGTQLERAAPRVDVLNTDPPDHTRMRHEMMTPFTPSKVAKMETIVRERAVALLEPLKHAGRMDLLTEFAVKLPVAVIGRLLGLPEEDDEKIRHWAATAVHREENDPRVQPPWCVDAVMALMSYFDGIITSRDPANPKGDVIDVLIAAERAGRMSHHEVLDNLLTFSIAGHDTTTKLIGNIVYYLYKFRDQRRLLTGNPALVTAAVEETLRYDTPAHLLARTVMADIVLHGRAIPKGAKIGILFASANRDERQFADPDRFDVRRDPRGHLGFGTGIHTCLGNSLARLETRIACEEILARFPDYAIEEDGLARMHSPSVRGFSRMPVTSS